MSVVLVNAGGQWYVGNDFEAIADGKSVLHNAWMVIQQIGLSPQGIQATPAMLFPLLGHPESVAELTFDYVNCHYEPSNQGDWERMMAVVEQQATLQRTGITLDTKGVKV